MTRYFFHMQDGEAVVDDEQGLELPDLNAAREEAIRTCAEMLRDMPPAIKNGDPFRLWVTDQPSSRGTTMFAVTVTVESVTQVLWISPQADRYSLARTRLRGTGCGSRGV